MLIPLQQLFNKYNIASTGVIHLGANLGQEIPDYIDCGIKSMILVEAIPTIYEVLQKNCQQIADISLKTKKLKLNMVPIAACLSSETGVPVIFNVSSNEGQSSSMFEFGTHITEHPTVSFIKKIPLTTERFDFIVEAEGLDKESWFPELNFLNADIQGAELLAMKGMGEIMEQIDYAYIEVNEKELYIGCPQAHEIDSFLAGFNLFPVEEKLLSHGWGDRFYVKKK